MADCLFCKIVRGEVPVTPVKRSTDALAFRDINPQAPTHLLVIPIRHYAAVRNAKDAEGERVLGGFSHSPRSLRPSWGSMRRVSDRDQHRARCGAERGPSPPASARRAEDQLAAWVAAGLPVNSVIATGPLPVGMAWQTACSRPRPLPAGAAVPDAGRDADRERALTRLGDRPRSLHGRSAGGARRGVPASGVSHERRLTRSDTVRLRSFVGWCPTGSVECSRCPAATTARPRRLASRLTAR